MKNQKGIARITLIIILVLIIVIGAFVLFRDDSKFEKVENEVAGTLNTQFESIDENMSNVPVKKVDMSDISDNLDDIKPSTIPDAEVQIEEAK